ncbi:ribonuclease-like 3 [Clinocottus analis]|uniref:ribonuclease-like 3 n=1 Tax=Clinocottus analis TaxID=304258 RepID=UPI0035C2248F
MRIQFACLLLLSGTVVVCQINYRYRNFINQHVIGQMSAGRCDQVIQSRGITKPDGNECKETNSFIIAGTNLVRAICQDAGSPYAGGMTKSNQPFPIIVCSLRNQGGRRPHCQYRGQARTRYVVIQCENTFPVHLQGDIMSLEN